ncbi:MAG: lactonase family protein [Betaproteobacteria bacterium]|nr:lactonase family protein [Betaproteobacteria bacterium]
MASAAAHAKFAYVGCFTTGERNARGKGISVYRIDSGNGNWTLVQVLGTLPNPQYLALDREQRYLYSAHGDGTEIGAYAIDRQTGELRFLNRQPTDGRNAPALVPDPSNRCMVMANGPGLAVFPINADGSLAPHSDALVPPGEPGPHRKGQNSPHPHHVLFDPGGGFLTAPDKGVDRVHIYRLDATSGKLVANDPPCALSRSGAGPRHIAFHPERPYAFVVNELDSTLTAYRWDAARGELEPFQIIPTLPTTYTGNNTGSEIAVAPSGLFVYASNRGHNSIAIFAIDPASGMLDPVGWEPTRGSTPRFFTLDAAGDLLYAANLNSDSIVVFRVDHKSGQLTPTGQVVETGSPSCIVFTRP